MFFLRKYCHFWFLSLFALRYQIELYAGDRQLGKTSGWAQPWVDLPWKAPSCFMMQGFSIVFFACFSLGILFNSFGRLPGVKFWTVLSLFVAFSLWCLESLTVYPTQNCQGSLHLETIEADENTERSQSEADHESIDWLRREVRKFTGYWVAKPARLGEVQIFITIFIFRSPGIMYEMYDYGMII